MSEQRNSTLFEVDRALFEGQISSVVMTLYQNELPPCGLAGILDWHFHGAISRYLQQGAISGRVGECVYFPFSRNSVLYHLILVGGGHTPRPGQRNVPSTETMQTLQKNLTALQLTKTAVSKADFGNVAQDFFAKNLKGVPLWIAP